ncbi:hypothetical protein [Bdellovibrio sp. HCB2-146]|uniref:hypothetical protein n=1 Tax=Bdellovibrio sp. HCB2-146 TaxID=3394362 RepID=UPI0039BD71CB
MKAVRKTGLFLSTVVLFSTLTVQDAFAQSRRGGGSALPTGSHSIGIAISTVNAGQDDLNGVIDDLHTDGSTLADTKDLGSAWEITANWIYRFDRTMYAFVFRPSYFTQKSEGSGTGGSYDVSLTGFTVFPIFRMYPLENSFIKFFMQGGLGYGSLKGQIDAGASNLGFEGSAFGAMGGIGVDFCFTDAHCLTIEGNIRYLPIERNKVTSGNCTTLPGTSQCTNGSELERNNKDLQTTMSGVQGLVGYTMNF